MISSRSQHPKQLLLSACTFDAASAAAITITGGTETTSNGLNQSHEVGIWTADGSTLLASAIVPSGTAGTLDSGFRFVAITPLVLAANTEYLAGAFNGANTDPITRFATATTDSRITLGSTRFDSPFTGYFGPNFQIDGNVPEPGAITLVASGILLAILNRRRSL